MAGVDEGGDGGDGLGRGLVAAAGAAAVGFVGFGRGFLDDL